QRRTARGQSPAFRGTRAGDQELVGGPWHRKRAFDRRRLWRPKSHRRQHDPRGPGTEPPNRVQDRGRQRQPLSRGAPERRRNGIQVSIFLAIPPPKPRERVKSAAMDTSRMWRPALGPILCWLLPTIAACQSSPADVREWTPKDHTNTGGATTVTTQAPAARADGPAADDPGPPPGLDSVTLAAWTSNCSSCHGK